MGLFGGQMASVIEWQEYRDDVIFWKWCSREIKKGSRLVIHQGQDAIFLYNGKVEGVFTDEGSFEVESQIIPFLSTLKGFKFGFNSGIRAEVLFINTKEFTVKWGTKNAITLPAQGLPGGMPIRAHGIFTCKVTDYLALIEKIAGVKQIYTVEDIRDRVVGMLDPYLMKWISQEGKDMFNLQANAIEIGRGIQTDLDMELCKLGISVTGFSIQSVSYPEEVQAMVKKAASQSMIGDMGTYQKVAVADSMDKGGRGSIAGDMVGMQMGMAMGQQMMEQMKKPSGSVSGGTAKFCSNCGEPVEGANFCPRCGQKVNG